MKLSIVATPIGNLEDVTARALRTLKEADIVACEDTRVTKKLLSHFDIHTPTVSFHSHSGPAGYARVASLLKAGKHVAYVSDAGTPGVSDPGLELVSTVREMFGDAVTIESIPGPSALPAAISISGLKTPSFTFYGFLPHKKGREKMLKEIAASERASIFFESPHRIMKALQVLATVLAPERRVGLFRELTKLHEESIIGSAAEVLAILEENDEKQRGEFVVIIESA
ncbi:MAG: 16S rRNA (cytidine(1402)-2'-O)-methyltransferase [Patescibacteria group bacterium]